ncbi:alkaline phosphatase D family protein [Rivibacter subsaxonicus]|uniref:Alkaline phosphatase D n=1 Tax=Rivibacter subsaxonicus TaxID=457575 RepID=A0A4Q7VWR3_9BURK|nr:alkaline phosphatase D family protein [Rivibacter subsaxonicus]RZU00749.1 alkaline phosphatase D [Rivibacter subsaxonicus]
MNRRRFLQQGATGMTCGVLGRRAAAMAMSLLFAPRGLAEDTGATTRPRLDADPFTLGVASGLAGGARVVLWTRLAPSPREPWGGMAPEPVALHWQLADDEGFTRIVREGQALARPEHAHSVHVALDALATDRFYYYRFLVGDAVSPVGRTRTPPAPDADVARLRVALASCQHYEQGAYAAHADLARRDVDLVLFAGDYIYEGSNPRFVVRPHEAGLPRDLEAYRQRHVTYRLDPNLQAVHAAHPWLLVWDDHEVENDYAGLAGSRGEVVDEASFLALRTAAYKAYFEHLPVAPDLLTIGAPGGLRGQLPWGQLADLWTLDGRQFRSVQACNPPGRAGGRALVNCGELNDERRTVFGAEQERWIAEELAASRRGWRVVAQGTQLAPAGIEAPMLGRSIYSDGWDGYPRARERLLQAFAGAPGGDVVCLGGDVHRHVAARLRLDPADTRSPVIASEFCCSSISSRGLPEAAAALMRRSNPDLLHARGDERGYALLEFTPRELRCDFMATAFPAVEGATLHRQARYVVERGLAGPQRDA